MTHVRAVLVAGVIVASVSSTTGANAGLILCPDGTTVQDTVQGITWLAKMDLAATNTFGLQNCQANNGSQPCVNTSGSMSFQSAQAWIDGMNAVDYLGHNNWQLPTSPTMDQGCSVTGPHGNSFGFGCFASALGDLYHNGLGFNTADTVVPMPTNTVGPFKNFQPYLYWSSLSVSANGHATFSFNSGIRDGNTNPNFLYVLPMIEGKLPGTPAPVGDGLQLNPDGKTVYDPKTNVTWLVDANVAASNSFGMPLCNGTGSATPCVNKDGSMSWDSANQLVENMNTEKYLGQTSWELPPIEPVDPSCSTQVPPASPTTSFGYNCTGNGNLLGDPMGALFYNQFHLAPGESVVAAPDIGVGPFNDVQPYLYWSCTGDSIQSACGAPPSPGFEWSFSFGNGFQGTEVLENDMYVTAYYVTPEPMTLSLFGAGLAASVAVRRRKKQVA